METLSKQELISTITKQADQIKRYEGRLRDVVAAYKGLVKEKEALEISLKALNKCETPVEGVPDDSMAALALSLSTLTAEKARMEEAFQADKKVTRDKIAEIEEENKLSLIEPSKKVELNRFARIRGLLTHKSDSLYESIIASMKEETKSLVQQHLAEVSNLKAKIGYEIQEREKERADHAAMMKELHLKLNSERKTKEKLEDKVVHSNESQASQAELEKRVRDLSSSLEAAQRRLQRAEARTIETPALLVRLQNKLALLEQSHSVAIREEQIKTKRAEESARRACAVQEERVSLLESKLAELSETVGRAELRRRTDATLIQKLKDELNGKLIRNIAAERNEPSTEETTQLKKSETDNEKLADSEYLQTLIDKIHILKKEFIAENDKLGSPIDITTIFYVDGYEHVHLKCKEKYEKIKMEFEAFKVQNAKASNSGDEAKNEIDNLKSETAELIEKLDTYQIMLEEERQDKIDTMKLFEELSCSLVNHVSQIEKSLDEDETNTEIKLKNEQVFHKEVTSDLKTRIQSLEKQVATQRDRYAALLEETDNYIRARNERARRVSAEEAGWKETHGILNDTSAPPHMLHYAHELARKDLDITQLRKEKHILEGQFRDIQREATIEKERQKEIIKALKEEIDRLRRFQSREGANLEYLKNVVISYLLSADYAGRKHMLNAIAAVLHFTSAEKNAVLDTL